MLSLLLFSICLMASPCLYHNHVVLIPKNQNQTGTNGFCPISLRNKLVTKVIANRLKDILSIIILDNQSAFTLRGLITNNILVAFKVFDYIKCHLCANESMTIKLDIVRPAFFVLS